MITDTIPVTLITGFLGAGKTTLLNQLGEQGALSETLVVINEFGQVGLDHMLMIEAKDDLVVELSDGCVCCTLHGDLTEALIRGQSDRAQAGKVPFERVVIETSGISDPSSIGSALVSDPELAGRFHLEAIVALVDGPAGVQNIDTYPEAAAQVALADLLIVTKAGLIEPAKRAALKELLGQRNPFARLVVLDEEPIAAQDVFDADLALRRPFVEVEAPSPGFMMGGQGGLMLGSSATSAPAAASSHAGRYKVTSFECESSLPRSELNAWLFTMLSLLGDKILRFKAIVDVQAEDKPTVLHAVQGLISPPTQLRVWPAQGRLTRMVFITEELATPVIQASLEAFFPGSFRPSARTQQLPHNPASAQAGLVQPSLEEAEL